MKDTMRYLVLVIALSWPLAAATSCESLAKLALPHATVTLAQAVPAGQLTLPAGAVPTFPGSPPPNFGNLPAICRVAATLKPTSDSDIKIEVWMPADQDGTGSWNRWATALGPEALVIATWPPR